MASAGSRAVSAEATWPTCWRGVFAPKAATASSKQRTELRAIAAIDLNVAFCEIAGKEARFSFSFPPVQDLNLDFRGIQLRLQRGLIVIRRQTFAADQGLLETNVDIGGIEYRSRVSGGRQDASPIRITARDGGFHQRRIRDRPCNARGFFPIAEADRADDDQFARAFTIGGNL